MSEKTLAVPFNRIQGVRKRVVVVDGHEFEFSHCCRRSKEPYMFVFEGTRIGVRLVVLFREWAPRWLRWLYDPNGIDFSTFDQIVQMHGNKVIDLSE
ncbi:MAG: hypothetical protein EKK55_17285 [Rhodocyclaceae bacterium]|nr:MAG: hypothetical protein EKK55_17285 [Rhodocyclaceae bacterium]